MRILITNDDGIGSPGLTVLEQIAAEISNDVWAMRSASRSALGPPLASFIRRKPITSCASAQSSAESKAKSIQALSMIVPPITGPLLRWRTAPRIIYLGWPCLSRSSRHGSVVARLWVGLTQ